MTATSVLDREERDDQQFFAIVHPLDDKPEKKMDTEHLGPMPLTATVRTCLYALRGYLLLMLGLLGFRVLQLAGVLRG